MKQRILYRERGNEAALIGVYGTSAQVELPQEVAGKCLTGLEPYAFSAVRPEITEDVREWGKEKGNSFSQDFSDSVREQRGSDVTEILLPDGVKRIGNYCFYGCQRLESICLTDSLTQIGGGAFTGCRLSQVAIDFYRGKKSCLKDVAAENRYELTVVLRYHGAANAVETAKLLFPEHYEEAVENTPARIVMTHYHGSGGNYRQCFYNKEVDYKEYDRLFVHAKAREETDVVLRLAFGRLLYPYSLSKEAKEQYEQYVREHAGAAGILCAEKENMRGLKYMAAEALFTKEGMEEVLSYASGKGCVEVVSFLMEEKRKLFPAGKKVFVW